MQLFSAAFAIVASVFVMVSTEERGKDLFIFLICLVVLQAALQKFFFQRALKQFTKDLINFEGSGVGVAELGYRTPLFEDQILRKANENLHGLTGYEAKEWNVLWMTGGGTAQFAAVPMNFAGRPKGKAFYFVTGLFSAKAAEDAKKIFTDESRVQVIDLRVEKTTKEGTILKSLRSPDDWLREFNEIVTDPKDLMYIYYCDNETADGVELPDPNYFQNYLKDLIQESEVVFVVDMGSNLLSRPMPRGKTGIVYAGAQKLLGTSGLTVVLIKRSLLSEGCFGVKAKQTCPSVMNYKLMAKANSMVNTPPVALIHLTNLVVERTKRVFGNLKELDTFSKKKSALVYDAIEGPYSQFYSPVAKEFRSRMNVVFKGYRKADEKAFLNLAQKAGMVQLEGYQYNLVGGLRASLYNAITFEECEKLAALFNEPLV